MVLPQAPRATCWAGPACMAPPVCLPHWPHSADPPGFLPAFEVRVQLRCVWCVQGPPQPTHSTWPHSPLLCASHGVWAQSLGSRKEAEQVGPVSLPGQGRARTTAERAVGPGTGHTGCWQASPLDRSLLDILCPDENSERPVWVGSGQNPDHRAGCGGPREASCPAKATSRKIPVLLLFFYFQ